MTTSETARIAAFERAAPSVAFIQTVSQVPFSPGRSELPIGSGSGFLWDYDGHIVTNYHVVAAAAAPGKGIRRVMVSLQGSSAPVEASVVGFEADKDIAVLKVDPTALPALQPLSTTISASDLRVGQSVLAIGNPFGLDFTLTQGIVSALGRDVDGYGGRPIRDCIQTDASINPGNSGGPLLDSSGRLIGVNTMIYAPNGVGANVGIGFAIPVDTVRRVVNQVITYGNNARPSIGVALVDDRVRKQYSRSLGRDQAGKPLKGAVIAEVVPNSPAAGLLSPMQRGLMGVLLGDMIVGVNGKTVTKNEDLLCAVEETEPEQPLTLTVMRNCDPKRVEEVVLTPVARKALASPR